MTFRSSCVVCLDDFYMVFEVYLTKNDVCLIKGGLDSQEKKMFLLYITFFILVITIFQLYEKNVIT